MPSHLILTVILAFTLWQPDETLRRYGAADVTWQVRSINGEEFGAQATLTFPRRNMITGQGPCNSFHTKNSTPYPWFKAGPIAATRMACSALDAETAFFGALNNATIAIITNKTLTFMNDDVELMVLTPRD